MLYQKNEIHPKRLNYGMQKAIGKSWKHVLKLWKVVESYENEILSEKVE